MAGVQANVWILLFPLRLLCGWWWDQAALQLGVEVIWKPAVLTACILQTAADAAHTCTREIAGGMHVSPDFVNSYT